MSEAPAVRVKRMPADSRVMRILRDLSTELLLRKSSDSIILTLCPSHSSQLATFLSCRMFCRSFCWLEARRYEPFDKFTQTDTSGWAIFFRDHGVFADSQDFH